MRIICTLRRVRTNSVTRKSKRATAAYDIDRARLRPVAPSRPRYPVRAEQHIFDDLALLLSSPRPFPLEHLNPVGRSLAFCVFNCSTICTSWRISSACGRIHHFAQSADMLRDALSQHCTTYVPQLYKIGFIVIHDANMLRARGFAQKHFRAVS